MRSAVSACSSSCLLIAPAAKSSVDPAKGQLTLVEAARILTNGGLRGVVFVLAGDNRQHFDYAKKIAAQAEAHGVAHLIRQIGVCPDMAGAYPRDRFRGDSADRAAGVSARRRGSDGDGAAGDRHQCRRVAGDRAGAAERARIGAHRLARRAGRSGEFRARDRRRACRRSRRPTARSERARGGLPISSSRRRAPPQRHSISMRACSKAAAEAFWRSRPTSPFSPLRAKLRLTPRA